MEAKELQVEAVFNLVRGKNTFILAGTGYGKSRIPEIYSQLLVKAGRGVVLVLNPLDSLGDNQVLEKLAAGFSAINLTKLTFNQTEAEKISNGEYDFVYLSPEIFLNNKMFEEIYFSEKFQNRLALVVVDEAHIIYQWGIVESSKGRIKVSALFRYEDRGIFRPSYGSLGGQLLSRNDMPILLMSATCRPTAVQAIQSSLKLEDHNLTILHGELTRPEIQIVRVEMNCSMASCADLLEIFPQKSKTPDDKIVPTLVYSGSRNRTLQVMKVLDLARGTGNDWENPRSTFFRRYHSCTGEQEKVKAVEDYAEQVFPVVSCTMALGMGQNWSRVRSVIHMGRGDPSAICQMMGRCGRDGRAGLAIIFVEKKRVGGKNQLGDFSSGVLQSDDNRMDALAITPVCLRIAFALDNRYV
jgi:ATP-dependent DNA helicase RecQ